MLDDILRLLNQSSIIHDPQIIELLPYGGDAFRLKLRATLVGELVFQIWLNHNNLHIRYAYQLFRDGEPLLRWDNAPHHPDQTVNFPHHFHDEVGRLTASNLSGKPMDDLSVVLAEIEMYLQKKSL